VFDKLYSFLFACAETNNLYKTIDRILIKDRHAPAEEGESAEAEEEHNDKGDCLACPKV
jgi:hypothetical protein